MPVGAVYSEEETERRLAGKDWSEERKAAVRAEMAKRRAQQERPGLLRQGAGAFVEGASRTAGGFLDLANLLLPPSVRPSAFLGEGQSFGGIAMEEFPERTGIGAPPEPQGRGELITQTMARGAGSAAPTAIASPGLLPALMEVSSGVSGEMGSEAAKQAALPGWAQFGAGLGASMLPGLASAAGRFGVNLVKGLRNSSKTAATAVRDANLDALEEATDALFSGADSNPAIAQSAFRKQAEQAAQKLDEAFAGVGNIQGIGTDRIKASAAAVMDDAQESQALGALYPWVRRITRKMGGEADLQELRRLRSNLSRTIREKLRGEGSNIRRASDMIAAIDQTLDDVAARTGTDDIEALHRALDMAKGNARRFGPDSVPAQLFDQFAEEGLNVGFHRLVVQSDRPVDALMALRNAVGDDPRAWAGVQRLVRDEVMGADLEKLATPASITAAWRKLRTRKDRAIWEAAFGPGSADTARRFLVKVRELARGGQLPIDMTAPNAGIYGAVARMQLREAAYRALRAAGSAPRPVDTNRLIAEAANDPALARGFTEQLSKAEYAVWLRRVQNYIGKPLRAAQASGLLGSDTAQ